MEIQVYVLEVSRQENTVMMNPGRFAELLDILNLTTEDVEGEDEIVIKLR